MDDLPPGEATTIEEGTETFPALILTFDSTVKVTHFFLLMQGDDTNNIWCELADIPFTSNWFIGVNYHYYIFQGSSGAQRPYTSIEVPSVPAKTLACWGTGGTSELYVSKIIVFGERCIWDTLQFSSFSINDEPDLWYVMYPGDTRDIDVPVFTSCMFPDEMIYTYTFSVLGNEIDWVTYNANQDKIVATVTQL